MLETELVRRARSYAEEVLAKELPAEYVFHNLKHTRDVATAAAEIGIATELNEDQLETVLISAWLHDLGYTRGCENHEATSVGIATSILKEWNASEKKIIDVQRTIMATKMPQNPQDVMGEVLCDADLHHLASLHPQEQSKCLRQEFATIKNMKFESDLDWLKFNHAFLKQHSYFTAYGKTVLQPRKKENAKKLKKIIKGANGVHEEKEGKESKAEKSLRKDLEKLKAKLEKGSRPDRGIETMFRTTSENHVTLSGMADTKANIMISINTIILSIVVSVLFRKLSEYPHLLVPTLMLVVTCLVTIVMAILATRPNVGTGKFNPKDIEDKKANLLFFGNFHNMSLKEYDWGMREMMKDYDYLYGSMIKDIYFLGKVLARKYKWLRLSYTIFMFGFVASILVFLFQMIVNYQPYSIGDFFSL
ncbi:Pycsar system effector family protein [Pseudochryseolinea flava]|uniref:HD family phosphohydrolase n=1 Tax=Pseudochryseolinea flava TaxID=2059302 RepID=A0A364Y2F6_9BACT|nr:Pycsar system effector family protein [Pseudochryseolinea flava]RAW00960.1 HD family phosphohydrolase [Pseudochryseolinea flava]